MLTPFYFSGQKLNINMFVSLKARWCDVNQRVLTNGCDTCCDEVDRVRGGRCLWRRRFFCFVFFYGLILLLTFGFEICFHGLTYIFFSVLPCFGGGGQRSGIRLAATVNGSLADSGDF